MMKKTKQIICLLAFFAIAGGISLAQEDVKESKDHPLFNRMPGFRIQYYQEFDFEVNNNFRDSQGKPMSVKGHNYNFTYGLKKDAQPPSNAQIITNYTNALTRIGGKVIYQTASDAYMKLEKDNKITWVHVRSYTRGQSYQLRIVEEAAMKQEIIADAASMAQDILEKGYVALYGIYFDFDKAEVKPESDFTLKEIAIVLVQNPTLKLFVVGHTDNVGDFTYNMKLSQSRADAVVKILVSKYNADVNRLKASGVGPLAPVTSNDTDEGKAKNRRVELVKQ